MTIADAAVLDRGGVSGEEITMPDRRESAWRDPRTWLAFAGIILTVLMALLSYLAVLLTNMNSTVQSTRDLVITATTKQAAEIKAIEDRLDKSIEERLDKLEGDMNTQTKAYNFNFSTRLAAVEAATGIKPQSQSQSQ